jgi:nucleoid-associated protein YgaU
MSCEVVAGEAADGSVVLTDNQCRTLDIQNVLALSDGAGNHAACGSKACVYETSDPSTLVKVTSDWMDVWALKKTAGMADVVPVKRMFKLKGKRRSVNGVAENALYAIEVARAQPLSKRDELFLNTTAFDAITLYFDQMLLPGVSPKSVIDFRESCRKTVDAARRGGKPYMTTPQADQAACEAVTSDALDAVERMAKRGVYFTDAHAGNWGRYNGRLVALDLGLSAPRGTRTPKVPELEGMGAMNDRKMQNMVLFGAGALILFLLLRPKKAKAETSLPGSGTGSGESISSLGERPIALDPAFARAYGPVKAYTVRRGDSLSRIAQREFMTEELWPFLWDINRTATQFAVPDALEIGQTIYVPTRGSTNRAYYTRFDAHKTWYMSGGRGVPPESVSSFTVIAL